MRRLFRCLAAVLVCVASVRADDYSLLQFLSLQSAAAPHFNPASSNLAFTTNISGTPQIWGMSALGSYQKQITFDTNGVAGASWSPTDNNVMIISAGIGGSDRTQLFRLNPYGSPVKQITTDDAAVYRMGPWTPSGERFAYSTDSRNKIDFDILEYDLASGYSDTLYRSEETNIPACYSTDARYLLIVKEHSSSNSDLVLYDATDRSAKLLTDHTGDIVFANPIWSPDGKGFYFISDKDREFRGIAYWPMDSASFRWVETPNWDVEEITLSKDGSMLAWTVNENGVSRFCFRDFRRGWDVAPHRVPDGVIKGLEFSADGRFLAFALGSASKPSDIWVYEAGSDLMHQVTFSSTGGIPSSAFLEPESIEYPTFDNRKIPAYLYRPMNAGEKTPVIIAIHDGPEEQSRPVLCGLNQYLLSHGYAILLPNIRGSSGYGKSYRALDNLRNRPDAVKDVEYAARWVATQKDLDAGRIALYGQGYGGFVALSCLAAYPDRWTAGVSVAGTANLTTYLADSEPYHRPRRELEFGTLKNDSAFLAQISPATNSAAIKAPLLLIQGASDRSGSSDATGHLADSIRARGGSVEYVSPDDQASSPNTIKNWVSACTAVVSFLDKQLAARKPTGKK